MKKQNNLENNIWKLFLIGTINRRSYIAILAIYFLSIPNTTTQQIGLYVGIGWLAGFLLEAPSGYISDTIGHKKTLIISNISMLISTLLFVHGSSLTYFILGSIFMAVGFSLISGTFEAFLHDTLTKLNKKKQFGIISSKITAYVSLLSGIMILILPLLTKQSLVLPIKVYIIFDVLGIIIASTLITPKLRDKTTKQPNQNLLQQLKTFRKTGFYSTSIFLGFSEAIIIGTSTFKEPFLTSIGFPVILVGSTMAFSRIIWFLIGINVKSLKKIKFEKLLFYEIFIFSGLIIFSSIINQPYIVATIFGILIGYFFARTPLIQEYYLNKFSINKKYKATMLSLKQQIGKLFEVIFILLIGFLMSNSFRKGFLVSGIILFAGLLILYPFRRKIKNKQI